MSVEYAWREGARVRALRDAQEVGEELENIRERNDGVLSASTVLDAARDEGSMLHPAFEWDDSLAAEQYRHSQAGDLIRAVVIKRADGQDINPTRAFVRAQRGDDRGYTNAMEVRTDADLRDQVRRSLLNELVSVRRRIRYFDEFAGVAQAIDELREAA